MCSFLETYLWRGGSFLFFGGSESMEKKEVCPGHIPLQASLTLPPVSPWRDPEHFSFRTKLFLLLTKYELNSLFLLKMSWYYKSSAAKMRFQKRCICAGRRKEIPVSVPSLLLAHHVWWHIPCCCTSFFYKTPASHSS